MSECEQQRTGTAAWPGMPWRLAGSAWFGWFRADQRWPLPTGMAPLGSGRGFFLFACRYTGDLTYDELAVASVVRCRRRIGVYTHHYWVSTQQVAQAKTTLWNASASVAEFRWTDHSLHILEHGTPLVTITETDTRRTSRIPVPLRGTGFSTTPQGTLLLQPSSMKTKMGRATMKIGDWPTGRFPVVTACRARHARAGIISPLLVHPPREV
ncbi:hypothetical protein ACFYXH_05295 [Streptomyces sp. NPDC002730]|uniref:hypothetical protein n=1 Tax=Streptomyces sp. NPDC002730 TaxID=3364662 RepID=UPI0036840472